jgi:hypothetical protein
MSDTQSTNAASQAGSAPQFSGPSDGATNASTGYTVSKLKEGPYFKYREELGASGRKDIRVSTYGQPGNEAATEKWLKKLQVKYDETTATGHAASQNSTEDH